MRSFLGVLVLAWLSVVAVFGQTPDFTGTWKQIGLSERVTIEKIEQRDSYLRVASDSRDMPARESTLARPLAALMGNVEYRTDGAEQFDTYANGRQRWRTVAWQGPALVFLTIEKDGYRVSVTRESWTLSDAGDVLTKTIRVVSMDGVSERTVTFQRE
jgi:hypothetical protein